jgi:hypothetical protein
MASADMRALGWLMTATSTPATRCATQTIEVEKKEHPKPMFLLQGYCVPSGFVR